MNPNPKGLNNREQSILSLAKQLLNTSGLDEATIDSQFLFRFDPRWCNRVDQIRNLIWSLMGEDKAQPFERDNKLHLRWCLHLRKNRFVSVGLKIPGGPTINEGRGYAPFHKELSDKFWNARDNETEAKVIWMQMWEEANQISKSHSELERLGQAYGLIPLEHEIIDYSPKQLEAFYDSVFNWVMWGERVPSFRWEMTQFIENRMKEGSCTIQPYKSPTGYWQNQPDGSAIWIQQKIGNTKRMTYSVRIRTWAVYYLSRRGGGVMTEEQALASWNRTFPQHEAQIQNFRSERKRLFNQGSKKRIT